MTQTFVLVHGGWHGGWYWHNVEEHLRAAGHRTFAPTLTGLGERSHLHAAVESPDTHVTDIVNVIRWNELQDVILVGHSYAGLIITGVAGQIPDRIRHLIYLDAFVPETSGQPTSTWSNPARAAQIAAARLPDGRIAPSGFDRWVREDTQRAWLQEMCTPQPGNCFGKGVTLTGREAEVTRRSYILADHHRPSHFEPFFDCYARDPAWTTATVPALHDAMIEAPEALSDLLMDLAGSPTPEP